MSSEADRSLNLDELMAAIRNEVNARRGELPPASAAPAPGPAVPPAAAAGARDRVLAALATAARYAPISSLLPEFAGWGRLKRGVARPLSRVVMYLSRFITNKQALFNEAILQAVRELVDLAGTGAGAATPERVESLRIQLRRLALEVRSIQASAEQASSLPPADAPASVALAARLESLDVRLAVVEERVARLAATPVPGRPPEGVTPLGRRARSET